jgi:hypothetical protein
LGIFHSDTAMALRKTQQKLDLKRYQHLVKREPGFFEYAIVKVGIRLAVIIPILGFLSGYARWSVLGFHPILQGALLGLVIGLVSGKLMNLEGIKIDQNWIIALLTSGFGAVFWVCYVWGSSFLFPDKNPFFILSALASNDLRESILLNPLSLRSSYDAQTPVSLWVSLSAIDVLSSLALAFFGIRQGLKGGRSKGKRWKIYRLIFLPLIFLGVTLYAKRPAIEEGQKQIQEWYEEVYAFTFTKRLYELGDAITAPALSETFFELENHLQLSDSYKHELPERHYALALIHIFRKNYYSAKEEIDRGIYAAEQMSRQFYAPTGDAITRDILLAQLYQMRAKLHLEKDKFIPAERDLTVAILIYRDQWLIEQDMPKFGLLEGQTMILESAGHIAQVGFASSFYERHLARKTLDQDQAYKDLQEAVDLGFKLE